MSSIPFTNYSSAKADNLISGLATKSPASLIHLRNEAEQLFNHLHSISKDKLGVTRESYGAGENMAMDYIEDYALREGLHAYRDKAANLVIELEPVAEDQKHIIIGSHLDSVPQGGNYDGSAGVIAGLLCLIEMKRSGLSTEFPLKVMALRGEESAWFGACYLGAKAILGVLKESELELTHRNNGKTLHEQMKLCGADVKRIRQNNPLVDLSKIAAYLELHIEQGPVLVARELPVAAVTGIRGNFRHRKIQCIGEAGHSGAVPRWLRHDAVFAFSDLITRIDDHWTTILEHGGDLVLTTGMLATNKENHALTRIPGEVTFSFEARSQYEQTLTALEALIHSECTTIKHERKVDFVFDEPVRTSPAILDENIIELIKAACVKENLPVEAIPSGAGHDASVFANAGIPSGMIFVRNYNGSHNPDEDMDMDDFISGVSVLLNVVMDFKDE
jgi:N-carbamoyl-L-amino-acid hydrolase